jgi:hypothetical protein
MAESQDRIYYNTKTGSIVTINDALPNYPVKSLSVTLEPIQDLHGYDKPWVGGAGKNKLPLREVGSTQTSNGLTATWLDDGTIRINGTATGNTTILASASSVEANKMYLPVGTYIVSGMEDLADPNNAFVGVNINGTSGAYDTTSNSTSVSNTFTVTEGDYVYVRIRIPQGTTLNNYICKPMIRLASVSDATFEPYSNICPISGRTEVVTQRTGKNLFGGTFLDYFALSLPQGTVVTASSSIETGSPRINYYDANKELLDYWALTSITDDGTRWYKTFTINKDTAYFRMSAKNAEEVQIELGSVPTSYEPFGDTYTTTLGRTVYGGTLDVVSGKLTVDRAMVDLGTLNWAKYTADSTGHSFAVVIPLDMKEVPDNNQIINALCSIYEINKFVNIRDWTRLDSSLCQVASPQRLIVRDTSYTDATAFKTAMDGVQLCYELATPQTYQLTPQQIDLLLGTNNVWSDGDVSVTYITDQSFISLKIYAGSSLVTMTLLPSPVSVKPSHELIWSENTGRAQSGRNKAKMIGDVVAEKRTYDIEWGVLTLGELNTILTHLKAGFFYFGVGYTKAQAIADAVKYYRGATSYELLPIGNDAHYKGVNVTVIQQ